MYVSGAKFEEHCSNISGDIPFSSPEPTILLASGRNRELWEQPFWNNKGNNRILPIRFNLVFIYGACPKWLLPELSIPAAGQKDRGLWGREWRYSWFSVLVEPPMTSSFSSFAQYKNVYISKKKKDIPKRKTPFFFTSKSLSNKQLLLFTSLTVLSDV